VGFFRTLSIFLAICGGLAFIYRADLMAVFEKANAPFASPPGVPIESLQRVYGQLRIAPLPANLVRQEKIAGALKDLTISFCDKTAIYRLYKGLVENKERQPASVALLAFADACPNSEGERHAAANILFGMGDYAAVLPVADQLVTMSPEVAQYYYLRGQALSALRRYESAIGDFNSALALSDDLKQVTSGVFTSLADAYAANGQYCQAMTAIQTYTQIDPFKRDTAPARKLVSDYGSKGSCAQNYARGSAVIPRSRSDVTIVKATVNGVPGKFIVDTGASLVALGPDFAKRANVKQAGSDRRLYMHTANGVTEASLATLGSVEIDSLHADAVTAAVMPKPVGGDIDGLLGMSFLARFDVALDAKSVRISERKSTSAD